MNNEKIKEAFKKLESINTSIVGTIDEMLLLIPEEMEELKTELSSISRSIAEGRYGSYQETKDSIYLIKEAVYSWARFGNFDPVNKEPAPLLMVAVDSKIFDDPSWEVKDEWVKAVKNKVIYLEGLFDE